MKDIVGHGGLQDKRMNRYSVVNGIDKSQLKSSGFMKIEDEIQFRPLRAQKRSMFTKLKNSLLFMLGEEEVYR